MTLTDSQIRQLIIAKVGEVDHTGKPVPFGGTGVLALNIVAIWDSYDDKRARLRELYTRRDCIDLVMATVRNYVDLGLDGLRRSDNQKFKNLLDMRKIVTDKIAAIERALRFGPGAIADIETKTPIEPHDQLQTIFALPFDPEQVLLQELG
jgi:hypothetical protein